MPTSPDSSPVGASPGVRTADSERQQIQGGKPAALPPQTSSHPSKAKNSGALDAAAVAFQPSGGPPAARPSKTPNPPAESNAGTEPGRDGPTEQPPTFGAHESPPKKKSRTEVQAVEAQGGSESKQPATTAPPPPARYSEDGSVTGVGEAGKPLATAVSGGRPGAQKPQLRVEVPQSSPPPAKASTAAVSGSRAKPQAEKGAERSPKDVGEAVSGGGRGVAEAPPPAAATEQGAVTKEPASGTEGVQPAEHAAATILCQVAVF